MGSGIPKRRERRRETVMLYSAPEKTLRILVDIPRVLFQNIISGRVAEFVGLFVIVGFSEDKKLMHPEATG